MTDPADLYSRTPTIALVKRAVCAAFNISHATLVGKCRLESIVVPRQVAHALSYRLTGRGLLFVGRYMGGRDHTTILNSVRKMAPILNDVASRVPESATVYEWIERIKRHPGFPPGRYASWRRGK